MHLRADDWERILPVQTRLLEDLIHAEMAGNHRQRPL
jgi:hypothetical protein